MTADTLRAIEPALAPLLADPRVKEIVIGPEGASVIWQAAEGDRGAHLILRQSVFPVGRIPADEVAARLDVLAQLQLTPRVQTRDQISAEHAA